MFLPSRSSRLTISLRHNSYWDAVSNNSPIYNLDLCPLDPQGVRVILRCLHHFVSDVNVAGKGTTDSCWAACIIYLKPVPYKYSNAAESNHPLLPVESGVHMSHDEMYCMWTPPKLIPTVKALMKTEMMHLA